MSKTARIDDVVNVKPFDSKYGPMFSYTLVLDNGETGQINAKSNDAFKIGENLEYTSEESSYGLKFKKVMPQNGFGGQSNGKGFKSSTASFALSYAKDLTVAMIPLHPDKTGEQMVTGCLAIAGRLNAWLRENE